MNMKPEITRNFTRKALWPATGKREGVVWDVRVEGLFIPPPLAATRGHSPFFPTLLLTSPHALPISEDIQTNQIDGFGNRTGLAETDPFYPPIYLGTKRLQKAQPLPRSK